ncbi:MAG: acetyl-CoA carboxylase carboxyltransferase subunit alpha [Candidatus Eiseniibacteriota bacterium]|nr:MAG: acetyl-CoA carboxylase carboxyltransferase subunit alpha [Candidatus Eisenbacteria bacterium]
MATDSTWLDFEKPIIELERRMQDLKDFGSKESIEFSAELKRLEHRLAKLKEEIYSGLSSWQKVQLARHPRRPYTLDYVESICSYFVELHGDRTFRDDKAVIGGLAEIEGRPIMVIGQQKGRNTKENLYRNFGMPHPEGYRKALRLMHVAVKFNCPIVSFIDTPGAFPGVGAEERGQSEAIARNLREMATVPVPFVVAVIGEGGSGGALAMAVGDAILMMENAIYSVITPEGCAAILWRDRARAPQAAEALRLTATDLHELGVVDELVPEPLGGAHRDVTSAAATLKEALLRWLDDLSRLSTEELLSRRAAKYRAMGVFERG